MREVEKLASKKNVDTSGQELPKKERRKKDHYLDEMEIAMNEELGRKVEIIPDGDGGVLKIAFYSKEDLASIAEKLTK